MVLRGNEAARAQALLFMFIRELLKSCIPHFPGEDNLPNTGTWEPKLSLTLHFQQRTHTHTRTDAENSITRRLIVTGDSQLPLDIVVVVGAKMLIGRTKTSVVCK